MYNDRGMSCIDTAAHERDKHSIPTPKMIVWFVLIESDTRSSRIRPHMWNVCHLDNEMHLIVELS